METNDKYYCNKCNTRCSRQSEWTRHVLTRKHNMTMPSPQSMSNVNSNLSYIVCPFCSRQYLTTGGYWKHKKICVKVTSANTNGNAAAATATASASSYSTQAQAHNDSVMQTLIQENRDFKDLIKNVMQTNTDLQKQMIDVCQKIQPVVTHLHQQTSNSHNKTFNLNFFLNEQCKDALNLMDFVESFTLQLSDLESVGRLGYVEGISNIVLKRLREMDIYKRPIHCSDAKREIMHVKDNNKWEKEDAINSKLRKAIKVISHANSRLLVNWRNQHPECMEGEHPYNNQYLNLIREAMGGGTTPNENESRIIRRLAKEVLIKK